MADPLPERVPVLIAGGGPVGLTLACELGWRGVRCLLVEQTDGTVDFPTANSVNTRSMEHYRRLGIARRIVAGGFPLDYPQNVVFATRMTGFEITTVHRPSAAAAEGLPFSPERSAWCSKFFLDPILRDFAASCPPVALRYACRLDSFTQDDSGVAARLVDAATGAVSSVRADYLVACDGGAGRVRSALGFKYEGLFEAGENVAIFFRSPALNAAHQLGPAIHYRLSNPDLLGTIVALDGRELFRLSLRDLLSAAEVERIDPAKSIVAAIGAEVPFEVLAIKPWTAHRVVADGYRKGRVFLAGDAAHLLEPNGGFGMNTGLGDAVDLAWKLAALLHGWGGDRLLDSYDAERRPIAVRNTEEAKQWHAIDRSVTAPEGIEEDSPAGEAVRARLREGIQRTQTQRFETFGVQLGYYYDPSPICLPDGTPPPPQDVSDYVQTARPGSRAPHVWLEDGRSTLDLFGRRFVLLCLRDGADTATIERAAASRGVPLNVVRLESAPVREAYGRSLVLVRPDGHVAWRSDGPPDDALALIDRVRGA